MPEQAILALERSLRQSLELAEETSDLTLKAIHQREADGYAAKLKLAKARALGL